MNLKLSVGVSPERQVVLQITDGDKIVVSATFEPDAAKGIADQINACAEMAGFGAPPKKMNS